MSVSCTSVIQCAGPQIPFENATFLTLEHQNYLNYFYDARTSRLLKWQLIYRGSIDGMNAIAFHTHCDNKGETFTILSSTSEHIFGGYTDANWTTPVDRLSTYGQSKKAFLFSLVNSQNISAHKFPLDARYGNHAIVNDFLSGPIFGEMMRPDISIHYSNGQFHCQIHFPWLYKTDADVSGFPTSDDCTINEIEVFIPVFARSTSILSWTLREIIALILTYLSVRVFALLAVYYNRSKPLEARLSSCLSLWFVWVNYWWGYLIPLELLFLFILRSKWNQPPHLHLSHELQIEKRLVMFSFVLLLACMVLFC